MKAAVVESPGRLVVRDIPDPPAGDLGEYDVLCRLLYGSTCTGTDQHLIEDKMPWKVQYPMVLGHESIGRAIRVGSRVRNFKIGDLITRVGTPPVPRIGLGISWGGFCEMGVAKDHRAMREASLPKDDWNAHRVNQRIPDSYDPAACTMIITWRETLSYSKRVGVGKDSHVLILGSGGTALAFVSHARNLGAATIACVGSPARETVAKRAGATHYFGYASSDLTEMMQRDCTPFDYIIDSVGKAGQIDRMLPLLTPGGMIAIYGLDDFNALQINPFCAKGTFSVYGGGYDEEETHDEVIQLMADGLLDAGIWLALDQPFDLKDISQAIDAVRRRRMIKALVKLSPE